MADAKRGWSTGKALAYVQAGRDTPSIQTFRRRLEAWQNGKRGPKAIIGWRTGGDEGHWRVDEVDIVRVRRQNLGELPGDVTAEQFAEGIRAGRYRLDEPTG